MKAEFHRRRVYSSVLLFTKKTTMLFIGGSWNEACSRERLNMSHNVLNWEADSCTNHWVIISPSLDVFTSVNSLMLDVFSKLKCMFRTCFWCLPSHIFSLAWRGNYAIHSYSSWLLIFRYIMWAGGKNFPVWYEDLKDSKIKVWLLNEPTAVWNPSECSPFACWGSA